MKDIKNSLVIIAGPTAIGKSDIAIKLAKIIGGEIISADSMQVYKGMDIGTAKVLPEQMQGIKHYLIDEFSPVDEFNVVIFQNKAKEYIERIRENGHIPIIVGGTGFYIQSVLYGIDFEDENTNQEYRDYLQDISDKKGNIFLHDMLAQVDKVAAERIHFNDTKRIIRALEYNHNTGELISEHNDRESNRETLYNACYFVLNDDRDLIYERINKRVDLMISDGLLDEVTNLKNSGLTRDYVSMKGLGYKEIMAYLDGECTLDEAVEIIKRDTRHFAKRQLTWFKREKEVIWIERAAEEKMLDEMKRFLRDKGIID